MSRPYNVSNFQDNTVFYWMNNSREVQLDVKNHRILVFDKNHNIIHGLVGTTFDEEIFGPMGSNSFQAGNNDKNMLGEVVDEGYLNMETKRTMFVKGTLYYVECKPLYYGFDTHEVYAVILIIIPFIKGEVRLVPMSHLEILTNNVKRSFLDVVFCRKSNKHVLERTKVSKELQNLRIPQYTSSKTIAFNMNRYLQNMELDMHHFQVWMFDSDLICIHASYDPMLNRYPLEYYIGEELKNLDFYDQSVWKRVVQNALNSVETKMTSVYNDQLVYIEAKPLMYKVEMDAMYGIIVIIIPYTKDGLSGDVMVDPVKSSLESEVSR